MYIAYTLTPPLGILYTPTTCFDRLVVTLIEHVAITHAIYKVRLHSKV